MTRATHPRRQAFTLIEMLVVIGIVVLLGALLLPLVVRSYKTAQRSRATADLQLIGTALEAYKADFGDYPRFDGADAADSTAAGYSAHPLNIQQDRGARLLCRALLAPALATMQNGAGIGSLGFVSGDQAPDGADGPGFRTRPGAAGTVYGPYIQGDKFKLGNPGAMNGFLGDASRPGAWDSTYFTDATLLDRWGDPILYYPASAAHVTITGASTATAAFVCSQVNGKPPTSTNLAVPLYNAFDNYGYGENVPSSGPIFMDDAQLQYILGDRDNKGYLSSGRSAVTTAPYLLWSAGPDGHYGFGTKPDGTAIVPATGLKIDDVTNFDLPGDLLKQ